MYDDFEWIFFPFSNKICFVIAHVMVIISSHLVFYFVIFIIAITYKYIHENFSTAQKHTSTLPDAHYAIVSTKMAYIYDSIHICRPLCILIFFKCKHAFVQWW